MTRIIVINADDFGLCEGVNRAISEAHTLGVLTSATLMANMPGAVEAVELARSMPKLGVGVHLNLVEGKLLCRDSAARYLADDDGNFRFKPGKVAIKSLLSPTIRKAIKAELACQAQWVIDHGIRPTHLDSHKHVHAFPGIFKIVCEIAADFGISKIRNVFEPASVCGPKWPAVDAAGRKRSFLLRNMARVNKLQGGRFLRNNFLLGVAHTGTIGARFFEAVAAYGPGPVAEVMTHPGYPEGLDAGKTRLIESRRIELDGLKSPETRKFLESDDLKLMHYGNIDQR
jgi:predicted glycoside hydrolase/deacetylase ChbG (UPF0249 family)